MLSDFTLDTWVPNLRWMVAHRMQRKMPNCGSPKPASASSSAQDMPAGRMGRVNGSHVHSMMPKLKTKRLVSVRDASRGGYRRGPGITRIPCLTVGAEVVSGHGVEEILQDLFIARLLALAQSRHSGCSAAWRTDMQRQKQKPTGRASARLPLCDDRRLGRAEDEVQSKLYSEV